MFGQDKFVAPGVAINDGHSFEGLGDLEHVNLAPLGVTVIKRLARKHQFVHHIIILIETTTQTVLVRHEQITMQIDDIQPQIPSIGDDEFWMFHERKVTDNYLKKQSPARKNQRETPCIMITG